MNLNVNGINSINYTHNLTKARNNNPILNTSEYLKFDETNKRRIDLYNDGKKAVKRMPKIQKEEEKMQKTLALLSNSIKEEIQNKKPVFVQLKTGNTLSVEFDSEFDNKKTITIKNPNGKKYNEFTYVDDVLKKVTTYKKDIAGSSIAETYSISGMDSKKPYISKYTQRKITHLENRFLCAKDISEGGVCKYNGEGKIVSCRIFPRTEKQVLGLF